LTDEQGNPVSNAFRNTWVTETALTTALNTSYMAEQLSIFGMVVGIALLLTGIGLVILALAVFGRKPAEAEVPARAMFAPAAG
jgi:multisubunit Na+/H+ antiporter MnhC subunit